MVQKRKGEIKILVFALIIASLSLISLIFASEYIIGEGSFCGDNFCSAQESCSNCQVDCGSCPSSSSSPSGGSGGGGGSSGGGGKTFRALPVNVEVSIVKKVDSLKQGTTTEIVVADEKSAVTKISFKANKEIQDGEIKIDGLNLNPTNTIPVFKVYKYFQLTLNGIGDSDLSQIKVSFTVPKVWMASNGISNSDIVLYKFSNNVWSILQTKKISSTQEGALYDSLTPTLSIFVIGSRVVIQEIKEENNEIKKEGKISEQNVQVLEKNQTEIVPKKGNTNYFSSGIRVFIFILSSILVVIIGILLKKIYKKYKELQSGI